MTTAEHPLAKARESVGLSRKALAEKSGVNLFTIERIETGLTRLPQARTLSSLIEAIGPSDLTDDLASKIVAHLEAGAAA